MATCKPLEGKRSGSEPAAGFDGGCMLADTLSWRNLVLSGKKHPACSFLLLQLVHARAHLCMAAHG